MRGCGQPVSPPAVPQKEDRQIKPTSHQHDKSKTKSGSQSAKLNLMLILGNEASSKNFQSMDDKKLKKKKETAKRNGTTFCVLWTKGISKNYLPKQKRIFQKPTQTLTNPSYSLRMMYLFLFTASSSSLTSVKENLGLAFNPPLTPPTLNSSSSSRHEADMADPPPCQHLLFD